MQYQTYKPSPDLQALIKCYWTLEVPKEMAGQKQCILPDGCMDITFNFGDDIKRYTSEHETIIQPRAMVLGQITKPLYIEPTGYVDTFGVRFYPYGFASFISLPATELKDKETPLTSLFEESSVITLERKIIAAKDTKARIMAIENFLADTLISEKAIDSIVTSTLETLFSNKGNTSIKAALQNDPQKRRQLERKFRNQIGVSPKQLGKVIRMQAALKMMLEKRDGNLSQIAYDNDYYDQAHFIRDVKEFTGNTPTELLNNSEMSVATLFYR